ncbi:MAG: hypothetical protein FWD48_05655 [Oscillospiraceae bacterium]|nr:hypothetical protein [Oscillospiraceae bacterium]
MTELIILAIIIPIIVLSAYIGIRIGNKMVRKMPYYVIGLRKKSRVILRDERLFPAFMKMNTRRTLTIMVPSAALGAVSVFVVNGYDRFIIIGFLSISIVFTLIFAVLWYKSKVEFYKQKDELGIVFESDETAVKTAQKNSAEMYYKKFFKLFIILAAATTIISIVNIIQNNVFAGIMSAVCACTLIMGLIHYLYLRRKK